MGLVAALLYTSPPNRRIVTFYTDDAASIRPGDTVRIAGIVVGTVKDLSTGDRPDPSARERESRRIYRRPVSSSSPDAHRRRWLLRHYHPARQHALGTHPIPKERVTMPYSLIQALTDTTKITEHVTPKPIQESINQLQQGLRGTNVQSVAAVLNAGNSIADTLDRQRGEFSKILNLSDEYIDRLANYRDRLQDYIRKIAILEESLILYGKSFR